jgi:peptide methionine sulfoxide reductase msrA/msrB
MRWTTLVGLVTVGVAVGVTLGMEMFGVSGKPEVRRVEPPAGEANQDELIDMLVRRLGGKVTIEQSGGKPAGENAVKTAIDGKGTTVAGARRFSRSGFDITPLSEAEVAKLAEKLKPEERKILLDKGTERAFCGTLLDNKKKGVYVSKLGGLPLFRSDDKFNSGTGWPSFFQPYDPEHIRYVKDTSHGMVRVEILDARSGGHLGHVFEDGPAPTHLRYCLNSEALDFIEARPDGTIPWPDGMAPVATETAYFAGGCFWGVEDRFQQTPGVFNAVSGYQGGKTEKPTYKEVCTGTTDHAETVMVTFDPRQITYRQLLEKFFKYHNPTTMNRQGPDVGTQYRSAIFTVNEQQQKEAEAFIAELQKSERFKGKTIVTQVVPVSKAGPFYAAEIYHQDYHEKNGGHCALPDE